MAQLEELVVKLTAETEELRAQLTTATKITEKSAKDMQKAIEDFSKNASQKTSFFQQTMATMTGFLSGAAVQGAFSLLKDAVRAVTGELLDGIEAANAEEKAMARLGNALNASGKYSQSAMQGLNDFAGEMERLAGVGDDVVLSNLSVLSSITRLDSEGLKRAQKSAIELSSAMGIDLDGATRLVGKAIEGNGEALKKYGIEVQTTSDKTQNLALVTKALNDRFGGAAAAQMNTFSGALLGVKNAYGNVTEAVATTITNNQVFVAAMKAVTKIFQEFEEYVKNNAAAIRDDLGAALISLIEGTQETLKALSVFFQFAYAGFRALATGVQAVVSGVGALVAYLSGEGEVANQFMDELTQSAEKTNTAFTSIGEDTVLTKFADKLTDVKNAASEAFNEMAGTSMKATGEVAKVAPVIKELSEAQKAHNEVLKSFAEGLAGQATALDSHYQFVAQAQANALEMGRVALEDDFNAQTELQLGYFEQKNALMQEQFALEQAALDEARANNLISETQYQNAVTALNQKQTLDSQKFALDKAKFEADTNKQRQANFKSTMDTIASLSQSGNKELAAIGKAAAITNATIDGYAAVQKALASAPPPFNFALAALVGAATAANVAKIAGVGFNKGIDSVPGIGARDSVPAMLTPGERVVPQKTNQDLTDFLANQGQNQGRTINLNITMNVAPGTGITREQAATLVEGINDYIAAGGLRVLV